MFISPLDLEPIAKMRIPIKRQSKPMAYNTSIFIHSVQELYLHLIDDFLIQYCQGLKPRDFMFKTENLSKGKQGKREYVDEPKTGELNDFFESVVEIPRIHVGKKQTIETLINEEALLLAKLLRNERTA